MVAMTTNLPKLNCDLHTHSANACRRLRFRQGVGAIAAAMVLWMLVGCWLPEAHAQTAFIGEDAKTVMHQAMSADELDPHRQVGHQHHGTAAAPEDAILVYAARTLYYAGLLATTGLAIWSLLSRASISAVRDIRDKQLSFAGKFTLLSTLVYVVISLKDLAMDEPLSEWLRIIMYTTVGRLYAGELLLALAAPLLAGLGTMGRVIWAVLFLGIESWHGHAAAYDAAAYTIALDFIHLVAAAVWAGGLLWLAGVWWKARSESGRLARGFARWALVSFVVLAGSGILTVLAFLPSPDYLNYTSWGKWLLAKIALTLLVAIAALFIRRRLRRSGKLSGIWLKVDIGLLAAIVIVVGVLTYQIPLPRNEPLHYHAMGNDMHLTLRISPNAPGDNQFIVKVWLPEQDGGPKEVKLRLVQENRPEAEAVDVPLQPYEDQEFDAFDGFAKYTYVSEGPYLDHAAKWRAVVQVTDAHGTERTRETAFRIY
jgi:copper transport protein